MATKFNLYSVTQAAKVLEVTDSFLRRLVREEKLDAYGIQMTKKRTMYFFDIYELLRYAESPQGLVRTSKDDKARIVLKLRKRAERLENGDKENFFGKTL